MLPALLSSLSENKLSLSLLDNDHELRSSSLSFRKGDKLPFRSLNHDLELCSSSFRLGSENSSSHFSHLITTLWPLMM